LYQKITVDLARVDDAVKEAIDYVIKQAASQPSSGRFSFGGELGPVTSERVAKRDGRLPISSSGNKRKRPEPDITSRVRKSRPLNCCLNVQFLCLHENYSFCYDPI
jgi:hypothetical protein